MYLSNIEVMHHLIEKDLDLQAAKKLGLPITIAGPSSNKDFFEHHKDLLNYDKLTLPLIT
jgi:hypothetical protein